MIDAYKKLKPKHIKDFLSDLTDSDELIVFFEASGDSYNISVDQFKSWQFIYDTALHDDDSISVISRSKELRIAYIDYRWWQEEDRFKKLFGKQTSEPVKKTEAVIAAASLTEDGLKDIIVFEGKKKAIVNFMNEQLSERHLKSFGEDLTVFKFDYVKDDENDASLWLTIDELAEKGVLTIS